MQDPTINIEIPKNYNKADISIYPNPFSVSTMIEYELTKPSLVQIILYNTLGEVIHVAVDGIIPQGKHSFTWSPEGLSEGLYYALLRSEEGVFVLKVIKQ